MEIGLVPGDAQDSCSTVFQPDQLAAIMVLKSIVERETGPGVPFGVCLLVSVEVTAVAVWVERIVFACDNLGNAIPIQIRCQNGVRAP